MKPTAAFSCLLLVTSSCIHALDLNPDDSDSITSTAGRIAERLWAYYTGWKPGDVPGNLPDPYYWWEAGAMFGAFIDYWHYTGDSQYNERVSQAMVHQAGDDRSFMPVNQSRSLGNDDQGFWGITAMSAAERNFPNPDPDQPQWLALAQAVFNTQADRWEPTTCGGGLRWQIFALNKGFTYKNTISNGCFFNIAARLASYTGNDTYAEWADRVWDWMSGVQYITPEYGFLDGAHMEDGLNCTNIDRTQWSYNAGVFMLGVAHMYNRTESPIWKERLDGIIDGLTVFYSPEAIDVIQEVACETRGTCDIDQRSFKAYLSRWMGSTIQVAPHTAEKLMPILRTSSVAAAKVCNEGADCGHVWTTGVNDGSFGVGEQMSALEVVQNLMAPQTAPPVSNDNGGTSQGDPSAGAGGSLSADPYYFDRVTAGDKAGAAFLTTFVLCGLLGLGWFMINPFASD